MALDLPFSLEDIQDIEKSVDPNNGIEAVEIDVDGIGNDAHKYVASVIENLGKFYYNEEFMKEHPQVKQHIETDIDSLKILLKMRKSDEITHDILLKSIGNNPGNASLYRSFTDIQRTILNIQSKIDDTIKALNTFLKGYQLEINFTANEEKKDEEEEQEDISMTKGSKSFIESMREQLG